MSNSDILGFLNAGAFESALGIQNAGDIYLYDRLVRLVAEKVFEQGERIYSAFSLNMPPAERQLIMHRDPFDMVAILLGIPLGADSNIDVYLERYRNLKVTPEWKALAGA